MILVQFESRGLRDARTVARISPAATRVVTAVVQVDILDFDFSAVLALKVTVRLWTDVKANLPGPRCEADDACSSACANEEMSRGGSQQSNSAASQIPAGSWEDKRFGACCGAAGQ